MNIGFFSDAYMPQLNGIATNIEALATVLERQGHCVRIFAPRMGDYADQHPHVYRLPSIRGVKDPPMWIAAPLSIRLCKERVYRDLDIVHVHTPFSMQSLALEMARCARIPLVSTYHTLLPAGVLRAWSPLPIINRLISCRMSPRCSVRCRRTPARVCHSIGKCASGFEHMMSRADIDRNAIKFSK
jgi:glycosyltransferase involved in cell wall biosynthesis